MRLGVLVLVLLVVFSFGVYAAGTSTGGDSGGDGSDKQIACESSGGTWGVDSCSNSCAFKRSTEENPVACSAMFIEGCGCGEGKCWNGESCESVRKINVVEGRQVAAETTGEALDRIQAAKSQAREALIERYKTKNCEDLDAIRDRIKCRLVKEKSEEVQEVGENARERIEEACRPLDEERKAKCVAFYKAIKNCYEMEGRQKDLCFKRASGITKAKISDEPAEERGEKARNYMITVLYNLQERVEKFNELGKISEEDAAEIIEKIVKTKEAILEGAEKEEIRTMVRELKDLWKEKITPEVEVE